MRKLAVILLFLSFTFLAYELNFKVSDNITVKTTDENKYDTLWKKVEQLKQEGKPKSALKIVDNIYTLAQSENNSNQLLKSILHILKFRQTFEEESDKIGIEFVESEINKSTFPLKPILYSVQAELYKQYYKNNYYKILERSIIIGDISADIYEWDSRTVINKIISLHHNALLEVSKLQKTPIGELNDILNKGTADRRLRPTLYDLLMHRAIDFYNSGNLDLTRPVEEFVLDGQKLIVSTDVFTKIDIKTSDSNSSKYLTIKAFQELEKFHLESKNPEALVLVSLERLTFLNNNSNYNEKDSDFYKLLKQLEVKYNNVKISTDVSAVIAKHINNGYRPKDLDSSISLKKAALKVCEKALQRFPESFGAKACKSLKSNILEKNLNIKIGKTILPHTYDKFLVEYKNVKNIYFRVAKIDDKTRDEINKLLWKKEYLHEKLTSLKPFHSESIKLPLPEDYEMHRVEVKLPKLDYGRYIILASANEGFTLNKNKIKYGFFQVSRLTLISQREPEGSKLNCYVVDLETGEYLKDVQVDVTRKDNKVTKKIATFYTDKNGFFEISDYSYGNYNLNLSKGEDRNQFSTWLYTPGYPKSKPNIIRTFFFTDRSIYRPGQTVYFKGIVVRSNYSKTENTLQEGYIAKVVFYDVNHQKIGEKELLTNKFGSFQGSFVIPTGSLNGRMSIVESKGRANILVEEYKRPKFEVMTNPVTETFRLGDEISVSGYAKSYSGILISDAKVKYHVVRKASFPFWWDWWWPRPYCPEKEILSGESETDSEGRFEINFEAIPDESILRETKPVFNYTVSIDITDINGETQSASKTVSVGYVAVKGSFSLPKWISNNEPLKFKVYTTNLDGKQINLPGTLTIKKLNKPEKILRKKRWKNIDQQIISKGQYDTLFPFDPIKNVAEVRKNLEKKLIKEKNINSNEDIEFGKTDMASFLPGRYEISFKTIDTFENKVEIIKSFNIYNKKGKESAIKEFSYLIPIKTFVKPGEKASFIWGSAYKDAKAVLIVEKKGKIVEISWLEVNNGQELIEIPVDETDRGGFSIHLYMVAENRFYRHDENISVPWDNKKLDISLETFRSKLEPGKKESWKLKISGPGNEKVIAELMAGMYDASLDAIKDHYWFFNIYPYFYSKLNLSTYGTFSNAYVKELSLKWYEYYYSRNRTFDKLNFFGLLQSRYYNDGFYSFGDRGGEMAYAAMPLAEPGEMNVREEESEIEEVKEEDDASVTESSIIAKKKKNGDDKIQIRKNLNESAFFYPQLLTNEKGEVEFSFTSPEALTKWKLMLLAHTQDLMTGQKGEFIITQKELMVTPNSPRFLRVGDKLYFSSKLSNLSDNTLKGNIELKLLDAYTMKPVHQKFSLNERVHEYEINKNENLNFNWLIEVPEGITAVVYQVIAKSDKFSDGEEDLIPILPDKILVTESMPLYVRGGQTKSYKFDKLVNSISSTTLNHHALTLEVTANPAWYAVMALPYMMEFPYECTEQIFNRYYANLISVELINSNPGIGNVFKSWKQLTAAGKGTLLSNLEKNEDLKSLLLQETPWVIDGKNETEQRRRIGILFDENRMNSEITKAIKKLEERQLSSGAWSWFQGMYESKYITQYIVGGIGHLRKLNIKEEHKTDNMLKSAIQYMDSKIVKDYDHLLKYEIDLSINNLGYTQIQYLYSRSFFNDIKIPVKAKKAFDYYKSQAEKYWLEYNLMSKAMLALALNRYESVEISKKIIASLKEYSISSDEMGMYWKSNTASYYWYSAPIETQSILIEAFDEVVNDKKSVDNMKIWLLNQKRVQSWGTTKATADACYALLLRGADWLGDGEGLTVYINDQELELNNAIKEPGTGYIKKKWTDQSVKPEYGNIKLEKKDKGISWGALHWQYFERLDKITPHETPLSIEKEIFLEKITNSGPVIEKVSEEKILNIGDLLKIRVVLVVDRDMEFVHLKDMRAAALEPVKTKSGYQYQAGIGYYVSIKDASVNFFFDRIPKGTYVFEYALRVSQKGNFQNGITTAQCMYAPEFNSHSEGTLLKIAR